jgi:hypothetical protein
MKGIAWAAVALLAACTRLAADERPGAVIRVFPAEGSVVAVVEVVRAELDFTRAAGADPSSLRLVLDGEDVTARASIAGTRDWPPSALEISYRPARLEAGPHRAELSFSVPGGETTRYAWSFSAKPDAR